jgi:ABC-type nitrate/sulfonate/bicarbonate transport system permease component
MASKLPRPVIPTLVAILLLGGWEWYVRSGRVSEVLVPAPTHVLQWFWESLLSGELLSATWVTMRRLIIGFAIGAALGVPLVDARNHARKKPARYYPA